MLKDVTLKSGVCYYLAMNAGDADSFLNSNERVYATFGHCPSPDTVFIDRNLTPSRK